MQIGLHGWAGDLCLCCLHMTFTGFLMMWLIYSWQVQKVSTIYTLWRAIHVQQIDTCPTVILRNCVCIKQVLILDTRSNSCRYIEQWNIFWINQNLGYRMSTSIWLVENRSTVRCICCRPSIVKPPLILSPFAACLWHSLLLKNILRTL